jgi:glutamyl-tRNA synthetase
MSSPTLRFAPSPTGFLHVGGARTALFNWLYARKYGGRMLLRVEDTDRARSTSESTAAIFEGLEWLGIDWDGEVVHQGANLERHQSDAARLLATGHAYRCFCTSDELAVARREAEAQGGAFRYDRRCLRLDEAELSRRVEAGLPFVLRFRLPDGSTAWRDLVHGDITFPNQDIGEGDFIILRSDGTPIYNLAVVSDDIAMGIDVVMRGDDHISNTPKQILLYEALGEPVPTFAHLPMIHGTDGKKLSKRHGATAVGDYRHLGILPEAMLNFLALLGWSPGNDVEIMTRQEMTDLFTAEGLLRKAAVFDPKKLEWMNGQHLMRMSAADILERVGVDLVVSGCATEAALQERRDWYHRLIELLKVRSRTLDDLVRQAIPYCTEEWEYDPAALAKHLGDGEATIDLLAALRVRLETAEWEPSALEESLRSLAAERGVGAGKLLQPLRVAVTGQSATPGMFDVLDLLGRQRVLARLDRAMAVVRK